MNLGLLLSLCFKLNTGSNLEPPVNDVAPVVSGSVTVGSTLSCSTGTWSGNPTITYDYQWTRDGSPISDADENTYVLVPDDLASDIGCTVTATNNDGTDEADSNTVECEHAPLRNVVTQSRTLSANEARTNKNRCVTRWPYVIAADCYELVILNNNYTLGSASEAANGNSITIIDQAIEANGVAEFVTYDSGSNSKTLASNDYKVPSDGIPASAFGLTKFTEGDIIWVKTSLSVPTRGTDKIPFTPASTSNYTGSQVGWWDSTVGGGSAPSATDATGVYTISGQSFDSRTAGYRPIVAGRFLLDNTIKSTVAIGDSIGEQTNDSMGDLAVASDPATLRIHGAGFVQRATRNTSGTDLVPMLNLCRSGATSTAVGTRTKAHFDLAVQGLEEFGTNDIGSGGTGVAATIQGVIAGLWSDMRSAGIVKIIRTKLLPRCTTTDNYLTEANQTYFTNWGPGGKSQDMNDWFDDKLADDTIDAVTTANSVRGTDTYKWLTDGVTSNYTTPDGTHQNALSAETLAAELRPILRS